MEAIFQVEVRKVGGIQTESEPIVWGEKCFWPVQYEEASSKDEIGHSGRDQRKHYITKEAVRILLWQFRGPMKSSKQGSNTVLIASWKDGVDGSVEDSLGEDWEGARP